MILRYDKNEKESILEMHKRAARPLYENFKKEEELDEFFYDDVDTSDEKVDATKADYKDDEIVGTFNDEDFYDGDDVPVDFDPEGEEPKGFYDSLEAFRADYPELAAKYFEDRDDIFDKYKETSKDGGMKIYENKKVVKKGLRETYEEKYGK